MPDLASTRHSRQLAFAKVNLGLKVLDRRPDGYHNVRTLLQAIDLADEVCVTLGTESRPSVALECDRKDLEHEANLAWLAADRLLRRLRLTASVRIRLRKRIPVGAGLGGGSSDAGAVLRALADLLAEPPGHRDLLKVASDLGSDVPYFLVGGTAVATGRGTEVSALPDLPEAPLVVALPGIEVSTANAYRALAERRLTALTHSGRSHTMRGLGSRQTDSEPSAFDDFSEWMHNDFEEVVFQQFPALADIKAGLLAGGARHALMSGTGSAVFGVFESPARARHVADGLAQEGLRAEVSRFLGRGECGTGL